jgi:hypothetical protein
MTIRPRHFAALQYTILAVFLVAVWHTMLTPFVQAPEQLKSMFLHEATKTFSTCFAIGTVGVVFLCALFWGRRAESRQVALLLAIVSIGFFGLAVWQFSRPLIIGFGLGGGLAVWAWTASNSPLDTDATRQST